MMCGTNVQAVSSPPKEVFATLKQPKDMDETERVCKTRKDVYKVMGLPYFRKEADVIVTYVSIGLEGKLAAAMDKRQEEGFTASGTMREALLEYFKSRNELHD